MKHFLYFLSLVSLVSALGPSDDFLVGRSMADTGATLQAARQDDAPDAQHVGMLLQKIYDDPSHDHSTIRHYLQLANFKSRVAISCLIDKLDFKINPPESSRSAISLNDENPAVLALADLGPTAIPSLIHAASTVSRSDEFRLNARVALSLQLGRRAEQQDWTVWLSVYLQRGKEDFERRAARLKLLAKQVKTTEEEEAAVTKLTFNGSLTEKSLRKIKPQPLPFYILLANSESLPRMNLRDREHYLVDLAAYNDIRAAEIFVEYLEPESLTQEADSAAAKGLKMLELQALPDLFRAVSDEGRKPRYRQTVIRVLGDICGGRANAVAYLESAAEEYERRADMLAMSAVDVKERSKS